MQEELKFPKRPRIDTSILSNLGEFRDKVTRFNNKWRIELEYNENARWRPGSYERLKQKVVDAIFPHWAQPKGANTIRKLTKFNQYDMRNLRTDMIAIDEDLRKFRQEKVCLKGDVAAKEGAELLDTLLDNFFNTPDGVKVTLDSYPFFTKVYRANSDMTFNAEYEHPYQPEVLYQDGEILVFDNPGISDNDNYAIKNVNKDSDDPRRWFINMLFHLPDIDINCHQGQDINGEIKAKLPYGSLIVGITIPLYDAVMNYRKLLKGSSRYALNSLDLRFRTCHTYKFPHITGIEHPFVYTGHWDRFNLYGWGNTCFGEFEDDLQAALYTGNMAHLKILLGIWSKTYPLSGTGPLNTLHKCHIGAPEGWDEYTRQTIGTDIEICKKVMDNGLPGDDLLDNHCVTCRLRTSCYLYRRLTTPVITLPSEFNQYLIDIDENINADEVQAIRLITKRAFYNTHPDGRLSINKIFGVNDADWLVQRPYVRKYHHMLKECIYENLDVNPCMVREVSSISWSHLAKAVYKMYRIMERKFYSRHISSWNEKAMNQWHSYLYDVDSGDYVTQNTYQAEILLPISEMIATIKHSMLAQGVEEGVMLYAEYIIATINLNHTNDLVATPDLPNF